MAYAGEHTLEAFSEFLEEQSKTKAEAGEKVRHLIQTLTVIQGMFTPCTGMAELPIAQPHVWASATAPVNAWVALTSS